MEIHIQNHLIIIAYSLFLGLIFGAGYDIIRIVALMLGQFRLKQGILFVLDLAYMLAVTASCSVFAYAFNHGKMRLFFLLPMAVGFFVYNRTVGRLVMFFSDAIIRLIRTILHYVVVVPIRFVLCWLGRLGIWLFRRTFGALIKKMVELRRSRYTKKQMKIIKNLIRI